MHNFTSSIIFPLLNFRVSVFLLSTFSRFCIALSTGIFVYSETISRLVISLFLGLIVRIRFSKSAEFLRWVELIVPSSGVRIWATALAILCGELPHAATIGRRNIFIS